MATTLGLEYDPHSLSDADDSNAWHIVNLTIEEVTTICQALHAHSSAAARELATALHAALHPDNIPA